MRFISAILLLFGLQAGATPSTLLQPGEEQKLFESIANLCGDTWCEGAFEYDFDQFFCVQWTPTETRCTLEFKIVNVNMPKTSKAENEQFDVEVYDKMPAKCVVKNIKTRDELVEFEPDGDIRPGVDFYEKLSACTEKVDKVFRKKIKY